MTPHRQEEEKKRVPTHVRVVVDVHCPVCGASFDDIVRNGRGRDVRNATTRFPTV